MNSITERDLRSNRVLRVCGRLAEEARCFRAYLAEENTDPFNKKVSEFSKVLHTAPWIEVLNRRNTQPFKKRLKFFLYDKNIALYFYSCLKLVKRKKYDIEDGSRNESKN